MLYTFGPYVLDTRRRELLTAEGAVSLRPKVFGLLAYLIAHRDRVVSKQELFDQLWPDVHVGDATLNTCIKAARQAVGDSGQSQAMIRTWHGHGYRFIAPVEERESAPNDLLIRAASPQSPPLPEVPDSEPRPAVSTESFPSGKEHKQVTVLHCILPAASHLAAKLGADAMDETMDRFMTTANGIVQGYGGTVIHWLGDGLVALFGAPRASEDHARRAVSASLDLLAHLAQDQGDLSVRIGLHTGPVVVGTTDRDPDRVYTAAGKTTETAKFIQKNAPPSTILASEKTFMIIQSEVDAEPFRIELPGTDTYPPAYLIRELITRQSGVPRRSGRLLSRFVGRGRELAILRDRLEYLSEGGGQVVSISGEPGIGKSRLVEEFERGLVGKEVPSFRVNCLSYGGASPYLPVRRLLRQICDIKSTDTPDRGVSKLDACLGKAGLTSPIARALLSQLLDLAVDSPDLESLSPEERRAQTFDHLYTIFACTCVARPCVIVVEDLHWIDATSEAWLSGLVMRLTGLRVLLLVTYRPGYQAPWLLQSSATQLALANLKSEGSAALVQSIPTATPLSEKSKRNIIAKAQGNPFFLEELTWTLGTGKYDRLGIPETVQTVIAARIDQLAPSDKRLLQIAAVIGPEVPMSVLRAIDELTDDERQQCLLRLQQAEFLYERQAAPDRIFTFKHALTQDVAYMSLVARTREAIHRRIANALESEFQSLVRGRPELLAHHLTESGEMQRATDYWLQAGRRAVERSANAEAIAHLTKGLELLESLPDTAERTEQEIAMQLALGVPLQNNRGPGSPETERAYRRASDLCRASGDTLSLFFATWGLWRFNSAITNTRIARDLAGELLDLAQGHEDPTLLLQAHHAHWTTLYNHGELGSAQEHIERGLALYNPEEHGKQAFLVAGHDPCVCAHLTASQILWVTGYPDQAVEKSDHALILANELGQPSSVAIALNHAVRLCVCRRDPKLARRRQESLRALAAEHGFTGQVAWCDLVQAWLDAKQGGTGVSISEVRRLFASRPDLAGAEGPLARSTLADACRLTGRTVDGLNLLTETFGNTDSSGQLLWDAEFHRLRGELLLSLSHDNEAEAEVYFQKGISTARQQNAKSLELRCTTSLARLWDKQGKGRDARDLLSPIYSWFTEGHDTPDLIDAKDLLDKLSR